MTDIPCIPCGARLLVIRDEVPEQVGSIVLAETSKSRPASGVVRMAGPMAPKEFSPGVRVLFGEYAGTVAKIGEAVVLILDPSEVVAFVEGETKASDVLPNLRYVPPPPTAEQLAADSARLKYEQENTDEFPSAIAVMD